MNKKVLNPVNWQANVMLFLCQAFWILVFTLQSIASTPFTLEFLADANFPADFEFAGTRLNGLSGITYDASLETFYIISDDRARFNHARYYGARIAILPELRVEPTTVVFLKNAAHDFFPRATVDFEGIVVLENDNLLISSEGNSRKDIPPSLMEWMAPLSDPGLFLRFLWVMNMTTRVFT